MTLDQLINYLDRLACDLKTMALSGQQLVGNASTGPLGQFLANAVMIASEIEAVVKAYKKMEKK